MEAFQASPEILGEDGGAAYEGVSIANSVLEMLMHIWKHLLISGLHLGLDQRPDRANRGVAGNRRLGRQRTTVAR